MGLLTYYKYIVVPFVKATIDSEAGASLVEYALLLALIAIVAIIALTSLGQSVSNKFSAVSQSLS
jgi:pilus assembly protein Flp/PilA